MHQRRAERVGPVGVKKGESRVARRFVKKLHLKDMQVSCRIGLSRRQAMRGWELRACLSLSRLWRSLGRQAEACGLVSAAVAPFTEGEDTADLLDARRQLAEMARHAPGWEATGCEEAQGAGSAANQAA